LIGVDSIHAKIDSKKPNNVSNYVYGIWPRADYRSFGLAGELPPGKMASEPASLARAPRCHYPIEIRNPLRSLREGSAVFTRLPIRCPRYDIRREGRRLRRIRRALGRFASQDRLPRAEVLNFTTLKERGNDPRRGRSGEGRVQTGEARRVLVLPACVMADSRMIGW
jgi:hypothetical protein